MNKIVISRGHIHANIVKAVLNSFDNEVIDVNGVIIFPHSKRESLVHYLGVNPGEFYELLTSDQSRLFFDYDANRVYNDTLTEQVVQALDEAIIQTAESFKYELLADGKDDLYSQYIQRYMKRSIVRNQRSDKHSIHVIYPQIVMNIHDMKEFVSRMKTLSQMTSILENIDLQVYRSNASLRTINSWKNGIHQHVLIPITEEVVFPSDYFITPLYTSDFILLTPQNLSCSNKLIDYLESTFGPGSVANESELESFAQTHSKFSHIIKLKSNTCVLCGETHKRPFFLTKSIIPGGFSFMVQKNGNCSGLYKVKHLNVKTRNIAVESSEVIAYQIAIDIIGNGNLRKTQDGLFSWSETAWKKISKTELGNIIINYKNQTTSLSEAARTEIEQATTRRMIVDNIYDILSEYDFPTAPDSYVMFKNGLVDIETLDFVPNSKDFNVVTCFNANFVLKGDDEEEDQKFKELLHILRKIVAPISDALTGEEKEERQIDWSRFKQAMGGLITGNPNTEIYHFYGHSDGGKSIIMNILLSAFGSYGYKGRLEILRTKSSATDEVLADYKDKFLTIVSEIPKNFVIEEYKLKMITEAVITADKKHVSQSTFRNRARTIIDSNYMLDVDSVDHSVRKRIQSFYFKSHFSATNTEENIITREFIKDDSIRVKSESGYYNQAIIRFIINCYRNDYQGSITPDNRLTLIHQARSVELKTLLDNGIIDSATMNSSLIMLPNTHLDVLTKYCPILRDLLLSGNKAKIGNQLALAISYLPEVASIKTPIIQQSQIFKGVLS